MSQNIEIKYRIDDPAATRQFLRSSTDIRDGFRKPQRDIYFNAPEGRLKIRIQEDNTPQLIAYSRKDVAEARISDYAITELTNVEKRIAEFSQQYGILAEIIKNRELFWYRNVRIHLDHVQSLGWFLELESVISPECDADTAQAAFDDILAKLRPYLGVPQSTGYLNLLLEK